MSYRLQNRDRLIGDVADGVKALESATRGTEKGIPLSCVEVSFLGPDPEDPAGDHVPLWAGSLSAALDTLAQDLHWDEDGDWSEASRAKVKTI